MDDAAKKDFFPSVMKTRIVDERIYGIPIDVVPLAMYYSLKAFEEAGLSESDIPKTWDQFLEIAHKLTKGSDLAVYLKLDPVIIRRLPGTRLCGKEVVISPHQMESVAPSRRRPPFRL